MYDWYDHPLDTRAPTGGEIGLNGKHYKGGEFLPFYVPRPVMPQLDEADYPEFFDFVTAQGWSYRLTTLDPKELHFHQRVAWDKVIHMSPEQLAKPILVSQDGFILDGNHRGEAHIRNHTAAPAVVINLDFEAAIKLMFSFPKTYAYGDGKEHQISI